MKRARKSMTKCPGYDKGSCIYLHDGDRLLACPVKTSLYKLLCSRFIDEVLPVFDPALYAEIAARGGKVKKCACCGKSFIVNAPRQRYCGEKCRQKARRTSEAARQRNKRVNSTHFDLLKTS